MQKINLLPSEIYNKISAGEVVENPASIVKELVENSIDAGSNNIVVEIEGGGISSILVSDNGHGINNAYIKQAFLPHATSKIASSDDLDNIATLGFRGEALPSIAAVSCVDIKTKAADEIFGIRYCIKGGVSGETEEIERNIGTTIEVSNLFFNTPARQKFLKKPKGEEHLVTTVMQGLILANPNVAIKYVADGKTIYCSNGKGLENALYAIYPTSITKHLVYLSSERHNIEVRGYIGLPSLTKPNRSFQTAIINGRLVTNSTIAAAAQQAYGNQLMKRMFPVYCLEIIMPFDMLDVNVTPNKTDVRFSDNRAVFSSVYHAVQDALIANRQIFNAQNSDEQNVCSDSPNEPISYEKQPNLEDFSAKNNEIGEKLQSFAQNTQNLADNETEDKQQNIERKSSPSSGLLQKFNQIKSDDNGGRLLNNSAILKAGDVGGGLFFDTKFMPEKIMPQSNLFCEIEQELSPDFKIIGQIFNCYLIVAQGEFVYLIDQHAAHERMIYDKLVRQIEDKNIAVQPLLTPQIIELAPQDCIIIQNLLDDIRAIGFDIEEFGDFTFKVSGVPIVLPAFNASKFINMLISDKYSLKSIDLKDILHNELAKKACKCAIKAGQKLKDIEVQSLIDDITKNKPIQCPHGRPTIIAFSKKDVDKLFKRIV